MAELMEDATAGDPISGLKWTHKSLRALVRELGRRGYRVSAPTLSRLLKLRAYSLRVNHKRVAGKQSPGREEQFHYSEHQRKGFLRRGGPVISVDTKKKELVGLFKNPGRQWRRAPHEVLMYDFPSEATGIAIPYGIYDVGHNAGFVIVGISHDTPEFAVRAIRAWWLRKGQKSYPDQTHLLIEADCGGSNGNRSLVWKARLQDFADECGLTITVTHYPTGASKWNPIEHRMFNLISANWAGQPLETYDTVLNYIRTTRSRSGFQCLARLDQQSYSTGVNVSRETVQNLRLRNHKTFPQWNYTIRPRSSGCSHS